MNHFFVYPSPIGPIRIIDNGQTIISIKFTVNNPTSPSDAMEKETTLIKAAIQQLSEYFSGNRTIFDVPIETKGTDFQKSVWNALCTIPYGETRSYRQIASLVNCPLGARAVGLANNRNPVSIIIPCHRVIGADGSLTGYAAGTAIKQQLLKLESGK